MNIIKYPDGSSYVDVLNESCDIVFKINSYEDLWHLGQILEAQEHLNRYSVVTIPNLIDAQAEKRFEKGQSSGLKLVAMFLNQFKNAHYKIFHPHDAGVVEALFDRVTIIDNSEFIKDTLSKIYCEQNNIKQDLGINYHVKHDLSNLILMSSDAGGFKPLMKLCDKIGWKKGTYSASKARNSETGKLTQLVSKLDFKGKDILIVDDISVYGGTFKGLSKMLKARNCGRLYLAVSHMTVQNLGEDPVTNYFDKVFTTNSKYDFYSHLYDERTVAGQPSNLEIIKLF
jgi:ribose-phosphate pyrophosphokinase